MERDNTSPSQRSYIAALEEGLIPYYNGEVYQQDNAPIHTGRITAAFLAREGIFILPNWPPYSPDLNPIEHL